MRRIYKIAKAELATLFYSPVAWFILVVFSFQVGMQFIDLIGEQAQANTLGYSWGFLTANLLGGMRGLFTVVQQYLYLYMPLLTMSLMSREYSSGSIKLLYASPVTSTHIILGKFLSMMLYGLVLMGVLFVMVLFGGCVIDNFGWGEALSGLLGLYLLLCAYAAIGLFVSSLTSYQVMAAFGTLFILAMFNYVGGVWQDYEFVRDITYWLSIRGRTEEFIYGLICSEDVLYFLIVIFLFLTWTVYRLINRVQKRSWTTRWGIYLGVFLVSIMLGYMSSRPALMAYHDSTRTKSNSLSKNSQEIVALLDGKVKITTYTNLLDKDFWSTLPNHINFDKETFRPYTRFKPDMKIRYIYFYDNANNPELEEQYPDMSDEERAKQISENYGVPFSIFLAPEKMREIEDLSAEGNKTIRVIERENGQKAYLRFYFQGGWKDSPGEAEISAAFKRLVSEVPTIGFLAGHGERNIYREGDREYKRISSDKNTRSSMINQGFNIEEVYLHSALPDSIDILVISELRAPLSAGEMSYLQEFINRGGNLFVLGGPGRQELMNPIIEQFGVRFMPGQLVQPTPLLQADLIQAIPTDEGAAYWSNLDFIRKNEGCVAMPGCVGLEYTPTDGITVVPLLSTDTTGCWNRIVATDFVRDSVRYMPETGDQAGIFTTTLALTRNVNDLEQRVLIVGNTDFLSNGEFATGRREVRNFNGILKHAAFYWLSHEELPVNTEGDAPIDRKLYVSEAAMEIWSIVFMVVIPVILALAGIIIWVRRRGR